MNEVTTDGNVQSLERSELFKDGDEIELVSETVTDDAGATDTASATVLP